MLRLSCFLFFSQFGLDLLSLFRLGSTCHLFLTPVVGGSLIGMHISFEGWQQVEYTSNKNYQVKLTKHMEHRILCLLNLLLLLLLVLLDLS